MPRLNWGTGIGLIFQDNHEFFFTLGYLANQHKHKVLIYTHKNDASGAWGAQGKIDISKVLNPSALPDSLRRSFSKSGDHRLSVSDYVTELIRNYAFDGRRDPTGNRYTIYRFPTSIDAVENTVPAEYLASFRAGYSS